MGRRRRRPEPTGPFEITVDDLAADARGVAHADSKAVFIPDSLPGEHVRYMRVGGRASYDEGRLEAVLQASDDRVAPRCEHFGYCGGCALQHLSGDAQLTFKAHQLLETLRRIGGVEPEALLPPINGAQYQYRRRARLGAKHVPKKGGVLVGFRERGAPFIANLSRCEVLVAEVGERIHDLEALVGRLSIRDRVPQIEVAGGDDSVALIFRVLDDPTPADRDALSAFARQTGLIIYLQPGGVDSITPLDNPADLSYRLPEFDVEIRLEPQDFAQIHGEVNRLMVSQAVRLLAPEADEQVLELFSGVGNFSLPLARRAGQVHSVEGEAGLVRRAIENARHNGIGNLSAHVGDLFEAQDDAPWARLSYDKLLLDPPRSGAREILPLAVRSRPKAVVYCSCHPATLARDAQTLVKEYGYRLAAAGVVNMFPHTAHIEAMALFELED